MSIYVFSTFCPSSSHPPSHWGMWMNNWGPWLLAGIKIQQRPSYLPWFSQMPGKLITLAGSMSIHLPTAGEQSRSPAPSQSEGCSILLTSKLGAEAHLQSHLLPSPLSHARETADPYIRHLALDVQVGECAHPPMSTSRTTCFHM